MPNYVYIPFIRRDGLNNVRGEVAGKPRIKFPASHKNLIVCKIDSSVLSGDVIKHRSAMLKLDKLQNPNTTKIVADEEGNDNTVVVYDYYDVNGRNTEADCPIITLDDVDLGGGN